MIVGIVGGLVLLLCIAVVVAVAHDRGPGPADVAVAYEIAWDRLDFEALWSLSGRELRDGLDRRRYVDAKRAAYRDRAELGGLGARVTVEEAAETASLAVVTTRTETRDRTVLRNRVVMARRNGAWVVTGYGLAPVGDGPMD
jgi:hypothetical protein